ncbi:TonB-dependent receptor family protein [Mucilaginibacter ginkgonis]|uniref:TonB-dependent receptor n=1 Tax=Mucilaginibacter ginkgonis TaxID=2682091 RepID=A0A7T7F851_9SPHI|nr:TonB-dependent receptor [Mucilaginibacter ginkgonis]QQL48424.1 TonB-dependent receptor [Mucilaginibacter ginkgonis]
MKFFYKIYILATLCAIGLTASAQDKTQKRIELDSVIIRETRAKHLPDVTGTTINAGKKTFLVLPTEGKANLAGNNARMLFAQVPGVNVWEMDGAGLQLNIGTRGTDTHRSIETNFRQNGYNTNSDIFGYPENHYTQPLLGVQEVQIVRGSAALQYGSQFGGMVNMIMKGPDSTKKFGIESYQNAGSNNFFNSYNAISGTSGKISYYAYYSNRSGDGWRPDAAFSYKVYYAHIAYQFNAKGTIALEFSRMDYRQQIAGGLTDAQFDANNRQATRFRNFFNPEINIPALIFNYNFNPNTKLNIISHVIIGQRNSVQFIANPNVPDTVNTALKSYNPRQVDRDYYKGFTAEARLLHNYKLGDMMSTFTGGVRYFTETTNRRQKGIGTTGTDFDLSIVQPYGIDVNLHTDNYAAFAENIFRITPKFSVTPGFRYELIKTSLDGVVNNRTFPVNYNSQRSFPLFGTGLQYQLTANGQLYGNISQAYRPYIYASVTPADQFSVIDPNLKDSKGYDIDLGYRGRVGYIFSYDVNLFRVYYGNRVGNLTLTNASNISYLYVTNIGNMVAKGIEAFTEVSLLRSFNHSSVSDIRLFNSFQYDHARYISGVYSQGGKILPLTGNYAEGTPEWIDRAGLTYLDRHITATLQYSYVGKNFSDANNTTFNAIGASGIVPAYHVFDLAFKYSFLKHYQFTCNINNMFDAKYFTRRINMYPGPGILPAEGRTFNIGVGIKI